MKSHNFMVVQTFNPISLSPQFNSQQKPLKSSPDLSINTEHKLLEIIPKDDLFNCLRYFLIFGKLTGVVPIRGLFFGGLHQLSVRKCSASGLFSITIIIILLCNTTIALAGFFRAGGRDATQLSKNAAAFVCYTMGLYVFIFIFRNSERLIQLLYRWREIEIDDVKEDKKLASSVNLIAGIILTSAITENAVSHLVLFPLQEKVNSPLEFYYKTSHHQWSAMIPYHPVIAIGVFLCNKWAVYAWNFGDIFIAVISRGIYGKFKLFIENAEQTFTKRQGRAEWLHAIINHNKLCKLTEEFAEMLSPLVLVSFGVNIYFICIQLHLFLAPTKTSDFISSVYGGWSFLHLLVRTYVVSLAAAKINDYAHQFGRLLKSCPRDIYNIDIERAERNLATNPIGINGLGAFNISRPFILSVISVIFTFEIVLLQTTQMTMSPSNKESESHPESKYTSITDVSY